MSLEDLTAKELREKIVELGLSEEEAENFRTKAQLITTIELLESKKEESEPKKVATLNPPANPKEEKTLDRQWKRDSQIMREKLQKQVEEGNTTRILVPLEGKEQPGAVREELNEKTGKMQQVHVSGAIQPVTLDGFQYLVPKGVYTDVPMQIADVIQEKFQQTSQAGQNWLIDRIDPETGRPVREQLQ